MKCIQHLETKEVSRHDDVYAQCMVGTGRYQFVPKNLGKNKTTRFTPDHKIKKQRIQD